MIARGARLAIAVAIGLGAPAGGCIFFSDFSGLDSRTASGGGGQGGGSGDGGGGGPDGAVPPPKCTDSSGGLMDRIPRVKPGFSQVFDGDAGDLCSLPDTSLDVRKNGKYRLPCGSFPAWLLAADVQADVRAGWAADGVHLSFVVTKATPLAFDKVQPYHGDSVQVYLADPSPGGRVFHDVLFPKDAGGVGQSNDSVDRAAASQDAGGYTIELLVPWTDFLAQGNEPGPGTPIQFDFIIGTADPTSDPEASDANHFAAAFCYETDAGSTCKPDGTQLVDDPSRWCQVALSGD